MTHHEIPPIPGEYAAHRGRYMTPDVDHQPATGDDPWAGVLAAITELCVKYEGKDGRIPCVLLRRILRGDRS